MAGKLIIIGTSHIAVDSIKNVKKTILEQKPDIVAIELDKKRLSALLSKQKKGIALSDIKRVGLQGWLFALFGQWLQKKLGKKIGIIPGSEMIAAFKIARQNKIKVALVDQDIEKTLRRFSKSLSWKEKWNFVVDAVKGFIFKKGVKIDLRKVPEEKVIKMLITELKKRYPNIYRVLIKERNQVIAKNLARLIKNFPDAVIVAVLGAGHTKEVEKLVQKYLKENDFTH